MGGSVQGQPIVEAHSQVTFVRFRRGEAMLHAEVLHQVALGGNGAANRVLGIFGFEGNANDTETGDSVCTVCYDRPRSVLLLPCRHCSVCSVCLRSLRDERCPLCRSSFSAHILLPLQPVPVPAPPASTAAA